MVWQPGIRYIGGAVQPRVMGAAGSCHAIPPPLEVLMRQAHPREHPLLDIVLHERHLYSDRAEALVREIVMLADDGEQARLEERLRVEFDPRVSPDSRRLESVLESLRDRLRAEARERGREVTD